MTKGRSKAALKALRRKFGLGEFRKSRNRASLKVRSRKRPVAVRRRRRRRSPVMHPTGRELGSLARQFPGITDPQMLSELRLDVIEGRQR
jgi:hypothetical protein